MASRLGVLCVCVFAISQSLYPSSSSLAVEEPMAIEEPLDLESLAEDFVMETKRLHIPGYPLAFNPSITRYQDRLLLSFRVIPDRKSSFDSLIGLAWLDDEFNVVGSPQILDLKGNSPIPSRAEDARLLWIGNQLYMVYSDNRDQKITRGGFRVYVAKIIYDGEHFFVRDRECLNDFDGADILKREKNWTPFESDSRLLLSYSLTPHKIFQPLLGTGSCETIAHTMSDIQWEWGELRGGTPGLALDDEHYLAFFHSLKEDMASVQSMGKKMAHYFMGAYVFKREAPYEITHISEKPIVGKGFYANYNYKPYWRPVMVVFPCGFVANENYVWVVFGQHDHEAWVVKLDKKGLLKSCVPVS